MNDGLDKAIEDMGIYEIANELIDAMKELRKGDAFAMIGLRAMQKRVSDLETEDKTVKIQS